MSLENFYLTDAGNALLARAQAGETLTFTRAQVGEGTWPEDTTYANITALAAPVKYLNLTGIRTSGNQATVGVQFSNSGVGRAFNWTEFALWAADPDHSSDRSYDILYGAAYADDTPVPIPSTLTEFLFNIIVKINRAANITVTVDSSLVYIPASEKGAPGGVATLGSDGKIPEEQVPMGDLSTSEIKGNLVDDDTVVITDSQANNKTKRVFWSDIKEILGGLFVPFTRKINNKALSSDVSLNAADVGASPAPNLLVNGNFAYNPKGLMTYTDRGAESVKGWVIEANGAEVTVDGVIGISIEIVSGHSDGAFLEVQELKKTTTASFIGKQITLSALIDRVDAGNSELTAFFGSRSTLAMRANTNGITAPGLYTATMEVTREIVDKDDFCVCFRAGGTTALDFHVAAVKLEIGTRQTLARQDEDGDWVLIPQLEFDTPINAIRANCYDEDGNFLGLPRGLGAADRNFLQQIVAGTGSAAYHGWIEVGRIKIDASYTSVRTIFSVCGVNGRGSGILSFSLRVDGTANVVGPTSRLYWLTLDTSDLLNSFAIEQDGDYAVLYLELTGTYQSFHIGILDYGFSSDRWHDPSFDRLFKLTNNMNGEGNRKDTINAVLTSSLANAFVYPNNVVGGLDYTTVRLRGSGLRNADTNPTANGTINWTYG